MMDANQTRYHLLLGKNDWGACTSRGAFLLGNWPPETSNSSGFDWDSERQELTLQALPFEFIESKGNRRPLIDNRRGSARDRFGNWYWIDTTQRLIRVRSAGSNQVSVFWPVQEAAPAPQPGGFADVQPPLVRPDPKLGGMAVTEDHYLVVGVHREADNPAGLLIFDLHGRGEPTRLHWPQAVDFEPFDMAAVPGGGVWILDRAHRRYWKLDRHFNVVNHTDQETLAEEQRDDFKPAAAPDAPYPVEPTRRFPRGIQLQASSPLTADDPCSIEALPDGTVLILDRRPNRRFSVIYRYRFGDPNPDVIELESEITEGMDNVAKAKAQLTAHDFAFLPHHRIGQNQFETDRLFVTALTGDQTYVFHFYSEDGALRLNFLPAQYSPMRLYSGKALVGSGDTVYYDIEDLWVPLVAQNRPRYTSEAVLTTPLHLGSQRAPGSQVPLRPVFDGGDPDCVWHRVLLDACIPAGSGIKIWSRAANSVDALKDAMWQLEPPVRYWRRDGSELPFPPPERDNYHTWEVLVQRAQGRYLQLRLRLYGDGRTTPRVRAMRVYYPRFSYLTHYLPAIYRDDSRSASLLDRYLANIEGIYTAIEDRIAAVQMLFDPLNAPAGVLEWLAQWFGVALDPAWEESRRRLFIQHAMVFFQYRGTVRGLKMALQLALSPCVDEHIFDEDSDDDPRAGNIRIIERFRTRQAAGVEVGDPTTGGGGTDANTAHYFSVLLPTPRLENNLTVEQIDRRVQEQRELGARIINLEKPAHTLFDIRFYWAAFRLGEVRLGIDTLIDLGSRSPQFIAAMILNQGYLGETYLAPGHPQNVPDRLVLGRDRLDVMVGRSAHIAPHREDGDDE